MNSKSQLNKAISIEINKFIKENQSYFDSFEKLIKSGKYDIIIKQTYIFYALGGNAMIETTKLPKNFLSGIGETRYPFEGPKVEKRTLEGIDEIQYLYVSPWTSINMHGHDNQWEVWVRFTHKTAHVCLKGEEHELVNNSGKMMILMAIKGHIDYSYDDLAGLLCDWGFSVTHGSLVFND